MSPLLAAGAVSFKKELLIVLVSLGFIVLLPMVALASVMTPGNYEEPNAVLYTAPISTTNTYFFGQCTYWAAVRREQEGKPIPNNWGNANTWAYNARMQGYKVDLKPEVGSIMQTTAGPYGHVAYVEKVNPDGGWTISEMNYKAWDVVSSRTFSAAAAREYNFIH